MTLSVTKELTFDAAHRLMGHPGKCKSLHGHTYKLQVTLESDGLTRGMVMDFSDMKKHLDAIINKWDHATILENCDPLINHLKGYPECNLVIMHGRPTAENMVMDIGIMIQHNLPINIKVTKVKLWETPTSFATLSYGA